MEVQQLERHLQVFGRSNRRVWLNVLGLGAEDELAV